MPRKIALPHWLCCWAFSGLLWTVIWFSRLCRTHIARESGQSSPWRAKTGERRCLGRIGIAVACSVATFRGARSINRDAVQLLATYDHSFTFQKHADSANTDPIKGFSEFINIADQVVSRSLRSSRNTVTSASSEKGDQPNAFDKEVPPLK